MPAKALQPRPLAWLSAALAAGSVLFAVVFFQRYLGLPPCPLCILDRYLLIGLALTSLGCALGPRRLVGLFLSLSAVLLLAGLVVSARHVYLEMAPVDMSSGLSCLPGSVPGSLLELLTSAFSEASSCALITWEFLSLSIAEQTFLLFCVLLLLWALQLRGVFRNAAAERL